MAPAQQPATMLLDNFVTANNESNAAMNISDFANTLDMAGMTHPSTSPDLLL